MLHIILEILKWIGIVLLTVLSLVILILLSVLFIPIRYKVKGQYEDEPDAAVTVSWFFHLIHLKIRFRKKLAWQVRIFGILFMGSEKSRKIRKPKSSKDRSDAEVHKKDMQPTEQSEEPGFQAETELSKCAEILGAPNQPQTPKQPQIPITPESDAEVTQPRKNRIKNFFSFISKIWSKIIHAMRNIRYTMKKICDKIKQVHDHIAYYHEVITGEEGQAVIRLIKTELGKLLLHIAPKKCRINVSFGFDDPATTGQIMAILGMIYPIWSYDISIHPDFENTLIKGNVYIRGRIRLFTLIRIAWKVYFNKNLKKVLVLLRKGGAEHG